MDTSASCAATTFEQQTLLDHIAEIVRAELPPPRPKQSWKLPRECEEAMARQYSFQDLSRLAFWGEFSGPKVYDRDWNELE